jgi:zinc finger SWIM domain-containing protein 3
MNREDRKRKAMNKTRVECRARIVIAQYKETGQCYVKDFFDEHNHPLVTPKLACLLRSHRKISDEQKASIVEM